MHTVREPLSLTHSVAANGYARGEGVCVILVKSLAKALEDGDSIRAVVRGTAVNHDGRTPGINLPSTAAQEAMIRSAYENAGLGFSETGYFEAHGTGTAAGDPLEAAAVGRVFASSRKHTGQPLYIGSVKSNIGHLEGGAGLAGLIKSLYVLEKGQIPSNLWLQKVNPKLDLEGWGLAVSRVHRAVFTKLWVRWFFFSFADSQLFRFPRRSRPGQHLVFAGSASTLSATAAPTHTVSWTTHTTTSRAMASPGATILVRSSRTNPQVPV